MSGNCGILLDVEVIRDDPKQWSILTLLLLCAKSEQSKKGSDPVWTVDYVNVDFGEGQTPFWIAAFPGFF